MKKKILLDNLTNKNYTNITIQNNIQHNNIQNNNIQINAFGNENLNYISNSFLKECIRKPVASIIKLIINIHFHKDHPENHNVYINNVRGGYARIHDGEKWVLTKKDDVIHNLIDKKAELMDDFYDENEHVFSITQGGEI